MNEIMKPNNTYSIGMLNHENSSYFSGFWELKIPIIIETANIFPP